MRQTKQEQIQELINANDAMKGEISLLAEKLHRTNKNADAMAVICKEKNEQIAELKMLLRNTELQQAQQEGYITRVREDDVVNEPLVSVGDPEGDRSLVPKRKHLPLVARQYVENTPTVGVGKYSQGAGAARPRKSWINY